MAKFRFYQDKEVKTWVRDYFNVEAETLDEAIEYVKTNYPEYERIITPKEIAERLEDYQPMKPKYKEYLLADIEAIAHCDAIFMCYGCNYSSGCYAEWAFAKAIGLTILYQND